MHSLCLTGQAVAAHYMWPLFRRLNEVILLDARTPIPHISHMKTGARFLRSTFLGLCASIGCAGLVHAQAGRPVPVNGPVSIVTTGGVTYAKYTWLMGMCLNLVSRGPVIRNGNNFSYNFELEDEAGSGRACPMIVYFESANVVLGALAPGTYTLTTTSWSLPVATNTFTIPFPTPILHPIGFGGDGSFQIQMSNGVANASYVLQCSTNLVNWTSISTNSVEQQLRDPSPVVPGSRYYRVQILQP